MTDWWYWALFALCAILFAAPWLFYRWEAKQDRRDAELWARKYGGDTYSRKVER